MLHVAFVGALSSSFADRVRAHLTVPCDIALTDEAEVVSLMPQVDVVVTLVFTEAMGRDTISSVHPCARSDQNVSPHGRLTGEPTRKRDCDPSPRRGAPAEPSQGDPS